jgi:hypothetical protein
MAVSMKSSRVLSKWRHALAGGERWDTSAGRSGSSQARPGASRRRWDLVNSTAVRALATGVPGDELRALEFSVYELTATFDRVVATPGVEVWQEPITRAGGARDAVVLDPAGNVVRDEQLTVARTIRSRLFALPGRLVNRCGRLVLRLPQRWPWATTFLSALKRIRALPLVT